MYYLLEDNRIFDSENLRKDLSSGKPFAMEFDIGKERNEIHFYFLGIHFEALKIKKQSESVYDLIDWNEDLIRIDTACGFLTVGCKHTKSDFSDGFYDVEWINAIYKSNPRGDYIKVWEKKND